MHFISRKSTFIVPIICLYLLVNKCNTAKILGIFHMPGRSQQILGEYLLKQLALRGHEITMLSPLPDLDKPLKNYKHVLIDGGALEYMKSSSITHLLSGKNMNVFEKLSIILPAFHEYGRLFLESSDLNDFLESNEDFDLVIQLMNMNEAMLGIGHYFNAPTIGFCTTGASQLINHMFANPSPYSMVPNMFITSIRTIWERLENALSSFAFEMVQQLWSIPQQKEMLRRHFPKAPPLEDLMDQMRVVLMNSHPAIEGSVPYMPNMIQIGGLHTSTPEALPPNFQQFMDKSKQGVALFSLGTNIKPSTFSKERLASIIKNLGSLDENVIMKFDGDLQGVPENIMVTKWMPQTSLLGSLKRFEVLDDEIVCLIAAHENMKVFITHSGLGGTAEAIYNAVPMVCVPFFGDQNANAEDTVRSGFGVRIDVQDLDDDTLATSVRAVLMNPLYKQKISATADFYRSQPMKPLDKAIYWVEHVLKHKGASHFPKNIGSKQPLYQYLLLDVLGVILAVLFVSGAIVYVVAKFLRKTIGQKFRSPSSSKMKNSKETKSKTAKSKKRN